MAQFLPATYLYQGVESILINGETILANWFAVIALVVAMCVAVFIGVKLFRWEKEERIEGKAKLWIFAVLAPFFLLGLYQAKTKSNITKARVIERAAARSRSILFQNVKIFVGNGPVIANGAVLVRKGKIAEVYEHPVADTAPLNAQVIEGAGKILMPGLIDMHVHLGAPGGIYQDSRAYADPNLFRHRLAAYLYSGVTAVRSTGDWHDATLQLRQTIDSDEYEGAKFYSCGPLFTAPGGHPTEMLENMPAPARKNGYEQFVRLPKTSPEARQEVDELKKDGFDCIKAVLESGNPAWGTYRHLEPDIYSAIVNESAKMSLPVATHTGNAADVHQAIVAGTNSVEHGSSVDAITADDFAAMKAKSISYDPTLSVFEGMRDFQSGTTDLLNRPLLQQAAPTDLLQSTRAHLAKSRNPSKGEVFQALVERGAQNLLAAYRSGVVLIAGSDAGNMLVIHGPTIQHELALWVRAGIPPAVALQAATYNSAVVLRKQNEIGSIVKGRDATLILLDGDPLADISNLEHISAVMLKGERINRTELFQQDKP